MYAILNRTQLWFCKACDKTIIFKSKSKQTNSKPHYQLVKYVTFVKKCELNKPDIDEVIFVLRDTIKDCRHKFFHSFEYRCVYDIKYMDMDNFEETILTNTLEGLQRH